jgi:hypothetical protein
LGGSYIPISKYIRSSRNNPVTASAQIIQYLSNVVDIYGYFRIILVIDCSPSVFRTLSRSLFAPSQSAKYLLYHKRPSTNFKNLAPVNWNSGGGKTLDSSFKIAIFTGVLGIVGYFLINSQLQVFWIDQQPVISDLIPTPVSPHAEGTNITWNAIASDPNKDTIYYKFELSGPSTGNRYVVQQNWSENREWIWSSGHSDVGINYVRVWVKDDPKHDPLVSSPRNYSITSESGKLLHSEYQKMNISETYPFMACVALNDSIDAAKSEITIFTHARNKSLIASNDSIDAAKIDLETVPEIVNTPIFVSEGMEASLTATSGTFMISLTSPSRTQPIPQDDPGYNYVAWTWDVTPIQGGTHDLILSVYDAKGHSRRAYIPITVIVKTPTEGPLTAPPVVEAAKENVTVAEAAKTEATETAAAETVTETAAAENKTEPAAKEQPGFESILAITGLLAVAYLVLAKRE